jgi:hypothetical protein
MTGTASPSSTIWQAVRRARTLGAHRSLIPLLAALALGPAALPATAAEAHTVGTRLRIALWSDDRAGLAVGRWTLRCEPPGGTLPAPAAACARLESKTARTLLLGGERSEASGDEYGGPAVLRVGGVYEGHRVARTFRELNSVQSAGWRIIQHVLGDPGLTA